MAKLNIYRPCYEVAAEFLMVRTCLGEVEPSSPDAKRRHHAESDQGLARLGAEIAGNREVEYRDVKEHLNRFEEMVQRLLSQFGYENRPLQETP